MAETTMTQPYGETVTTTAFSKRVGYYYDEAIRHAVGLERHGEVRVVMVPADEYASLRRLFARALQQDQLKDVVEEITSTTPAYHPDAPDSYEDEPGEAAKPQRGPPAARKRQAATA